MILYAAAAIFYLLFGAGFSAAIDHEIQRRDHNWSGGKRVCSVLATFIGWPFFLGSMVASYLSQEIKP